MPSFDSMRLPVERTEVAPDGSDVRVLLVLAAGGLAHFQLGPGETSRATMHRTVEEIWYFLAGRGEMWREQEARAEIVEVSPGLCLTIPLGHPVSISVIRRRASGRHRSHNAALARRRRSHRGSGTVATNGALNRLNP